MANNDISLTAMSRRTALRLIAAVGAATLVGCGEGDDASEDTATSAATTATTASGATASCVLTPTLTEGPYFVDERLNRSDITGGQAGLPLRLNISVYNANTAACSAIAGVQVDVWHANGTGAYSDIAMLGTTGQTFLRGYQVTDANGTVAFTTIYPGWYMGRATHIHLKARIFNAAGNTTLEATTQLFFDDSVTDSVYANNAPYNTRGARDTRNAQDNIFNGNTILLLALTGSSTAGYTGAMTIGIAL
jgi:protocatechuate 3,4-dioxygenase beta subunit